MYPAYSTPKINVRFLYYCALFNKFGPLYNFSSMVCLSLSHHLAIYLAPFISILRYYNYPSIVQIERSLLTNSLGELWNKWNIVSVFWYLLGSETSYNSHHHRLCFTIKRLNLWLAQLHWTHWSWTALLNCLVSLRIVSGCATVLGVEISMPFNIAQISL